MLSVNSQQQRYILKRQHDVEVKWGEWERKVEKIIKVKAWKKTKNRNEEQELRTNPEQGDKIMIYSEEMEERNGKKEDY